MTRRGVKKLHDGSIILDISNIRSAVKPETDCSYLHGCFFSHFSFVVG